MRSLLFPASLFLTGLLLSVPALSQSVSPEKLVPEFQPGVHYFEIPDPGSVPDASQVLVNEFFWYGCIHCFRFEPLLLEWQQQQPQDVVFEPVPAIWNGIMETHARMFYTAKKLGLLEQAHQRFFDNLNVMGQRLDNAGKIAATLAEYGADEDRVKATLNSPEITAQVQQARQLNSHYRIGGTPQMVVQGKYRVETNESVPNHEAMLSVVNFLVNKIRRENNPSH